MNDNSKIERFQTEKIKEEILKLGFSITGFARAEVDTSYSTFNQIISNNFTRNKNTPMIEKTKKALKKYGICYIEQYKLTKVNK
ncbi:MAG: hypothetical protein GTO02_00675 [Candidatus Dadabacteria bacterium]|nr:hypothetical protein [Candidatus Dadabacteria bacterium]